MQNGRRAAQDIAGRPHVTQFRSHDPVVADLERETTSSSSWWICKMLLILLQTVAALNVPIACEFKRVTFSIVFPNIALTPRSCFLCPGNIKVCKIFSKRLISENFDHNSETKPQLYYYYLALMFLVFLIMFWRCCRTCHARFVSAINIFGVHIEILLSLNYAVRLWTLCYRQ